MALLSEGGSPIALDGARKSRGNLTRNRIRWVILALVLVFGTVAGRLIQLGSVVTETTIEGQERDLITASRPALLDRNGLEMAVDIRVPSLYAEPRRIIDVEEAVQKLRTVLPDLNEDWLRKRLTGDKGFVWVKRELTPAIEDAIFALGLPGFDFVQESKRFYPGAREASHILGATNIDNQGIAGIEKYMDDENVALLQSLGLARGNELAPVNLSIDLRVQYALRWCHGSYLPKYRVRAGPSAVRQALQMRAPGIRRHSVLRWWPALPLRQKSGLCPGHRAAIAQWRLQ